MRPTQKKLASVLTENGYKLTSQRRTVLKAISDSNEHMTSADVYERARQENPKVGLVTVYRTLELLSDLHLICRVHRGGRSRSYTLAPAGHHHHMVCTQCGAVADFTTCNLSELEKELSRDTGFDIEGHLLQFTGRCPNCKA